MPPRVVNAANRTLDALQSDAPFSEREEALAGWPGWGPLAPAFERDSTGAWEQLHERLAEELNENELGVAAKSLDQQFFTPDWLVDHLWEILDAAGLDGGTVIEPGCGSGAIMSRAPRSGSPLNLIGVEIDPFAARIAQARTPEADIICARLEKTALPAGADAVIGNVPFASGAIFDATTSSKNLHSYFITRGLESLRIGGYLVVITSRSTMDGQGDLPNILGDGGGELVGAVRLPGGIFESTDVVSDILVLRRTRETSRPNQRATPGSSLVQFGQTSVSTWWKEHPELIAGTMAAGTHHMAPVTVRADDPRAAVAEAVGHLIELVRESPMFGMTIAPEDQHETEEPDGAAEGTFRIEDGQIQQMRDGAWTDVKQSAELHMLVNLRDLTAELLRLESDLFAGAAERETVRETTRAAYEAYVKKYGALNRGTLHEGKVDAETGMPSLSWRRPRLGGFRQDPGYLSVMAIENYDQDTDSAEAAPVLLRRVNLPHQVIESVDTIEEAVAVSMGENGRIDPRHVARLLSIDEAAAEVALESVAFREPWGQWVRRDDYLSGNVVEKLDDARRAATRDPSMGRAVAALEAVVPRRLGPQEISVRLGAPYISERDVKDFLKQQFGYENASVTHDVTTAYWEISSYSHATPKVSARWGTQDFSPIELVALASNGKAPIAYDEEWSNTKGRYLKTKNGDRTLAAQERTNDIQDVFGIWVWEDAERSARVVEEYNRRFNAFVPRAADGSWIHFDGMSDTFSPYPWQVNMVDRILSSRAALCGHAVGAGKTATMAMTVWSLRRYGLARKPMVVVPNHLLEQIAREMQQIFPTGRFLVAGKDDLSGDGRRLFTARCATGDWDAVVMTHSGFASIPVRPETEAEYNRERLSVFREAARDRGWSAKALSRAIRSYEAKLERLSASALIDDTAVSFEELGVDYIAVDEAHYFKRLDFASSRAEGFSFGSSKRATDLYLKSEWIKRRKTGPHLGLFTGTPWTNSLAETYVWQLFCQPETLDHAGVRDFDAWAANFVRRETVVQVTPDGSGFRTVTRPTRMMNLPELLGMFSQFADILTADDIGLDRPERETLSFGVGMGPEQEEYVADLVRRAEELRTGNAKNSNDNILAICGEGRRVALDPELVGHPGAAPKIVEAADEVARIWSEHRDRVYVEGTAPGCLQVIFCDQGTPSPDKGAQTYGRIRALLVERGIPARKIRFIHEATDDKSRAALFSACRSGEISVLIGSTEKLGTGANIQTRLKAIHHVDAPWRPSDIEQRDGRALRPHNLNASVTIARYVTERTFDAFMWDTLERKALAFTAMYSPKEGVREAEDIGEVQPSYTQMKAIASGNPLLLEQADAAAEVRRLRTLKAVDRQAISGIENSIPERRRRAEQSLPARLDVLRDLQAEVHRMPDLRGVVESQVLSSFGYEAKIWPGLLLWIIPGRVMKSLRYRGSTVAEIPMNLSLRLEKNQQKALPSVADWTFETLDRIDEIVATAEERLREAEADLADRIDAVATYAFTRQDELTAAEKDLSRIEQLISAEAEEAERVDQAA